MIDKIRPPSNPLLTYLLKTGCQPCGSAILYTAYPSTRAYTLDLLVFLVALLDRLSASAGASPATLALPISFGTSWAPPGFETLPVFGIEGLGALPTTLGTSKAPPILLVLFKAPLAGPATALEVPFVSLSASFFLPAAEDGMDAFAGIEEVSCLGIVDGPYF